MFYDYRNLNSIDLSSFNTNNVTNMSFMFSGCSSLNSIDLSEFNTNNVTNMSLMFSFCSSLKSYSIITSDKKLLQYIKEKFNI